MSSFDMLILAISILILSPFIVVLLIMLGIAILFVLAIVGAIITVIWDNVCRLIKFIKRLIK